MGVPPAKLTFAFGLGDELREDLASEMSCPAAEGGSFAGGGAGDIPRDFGVVTPDDVAVLGFCTASGTFDKPNT